MLPAAPASVDTLVLKKPAWHGKDLVGGGSAALAVDGIPTTCATSTTPVYSASPYTTAPWFAVDMGAIYTVMAAAMFVGGEYCVQGG
jgi:hypothetical protein